jgi:hypothetical protein
VTLRLLATVAAMLLPAVFAAPAHAVLPPGNVVVNGDAEAGPGAGNASDHPDVPGWTVIPNFTAVMYGTAGGFPTVAEAPTIGGGRNFFAGGPDAGFGDISGATQQVDVSGAAPEIDAGNVNAILSADIGGFADQDDSANVAAVFSDADGQSFNGALAVEPATAEQRGGRTGFLERVACTSISPGARSVFVQVIAQRVTPSYNDGYVDNIALRLTTSPCPTNENAPLPPPVETPQARVNANAEVARGRVFVRRPGGTEFIELREARSIPIGAEVDASKGAVALQTAATTSGGTQTGQFYDGSFTLTQTAGARPITDLTVTGRIDKCSGTGKDTVHSAARSRRLWGNARGRFRTRGRYATATVRGTLWQVRDTCNTTTVTVGRGSVVVRDLAKRRNVRLKAPKRYTARRKRR